MKVEAKPCPCGCKKFIVSPLFGNVESSLYKEDADELVRRWNAFEGPMIIQRGDPILGHNDDRADWLRAQFARLGSKGGKKKGATKKRGSAKHYREMARARWEKTEK